jgi:N-acyl-D-amino-acid deacylase
MVFHGMGDEDVKRIMQYPFNMFASDASIRVFNQGAPHPRGYGTNARVLGKYVREEKVISLEEAVRRMSSLPAQKFGLRDRGLLREGFAADIVIFNEKEVIDLSTYEKPHAYSKGFQYVLVNGQLVVEEGKHNGTRNGKTLSPAAQANNQPVLQIRRGSFSASSSCISICLGMTQTELLHQHFVGSVNSCLCYQTVF